MRLAELSRGLFCFAFPLFFAQEVNNLMGNWNDHPSSGLSIKSSYEVTFICLTVIASIPFPVLRVAAGINQAC